MKIRTYKIQEFLDWRI